LATAWRAPATARYTVLPSTEGSGRMATFVIRLSFFRL
jgi:hypothetical protein